MRLEKRIRALESKMLSDPVILYFPDGTTRQICGRGDYLLRLFCVACGGGDLSPRQAEQLELIRQSVDVQEPGGGRMVEFLQCFLHGPTEGPGGVVSPRQVCVSQKQ
jgi:hypothetical protein